MILIVIYISTILFLGFFLVRSREFQELTGWKQIVVFFISPIVLAREIWKDIFGSKNRRWSP